MRFFCHLTAVVLVAGFPSLVAAQTPAASRAGCNLPHASGVAQQQITSKTRPRTYRLFVPEGYDGRTALPLVLDLHPSGGTSDGQARTSGFETLAAKENIVVVSPQAENGRWNVPVQADRPDDVTYIKDVLDHVESQVCIDSSRIYATGFSGGGRMASLLACTMNSRIAAFAPMSSLRWPAPCGGRPIPVLTLHGLADPQNTYAGHVEGRNGEWVESVEEALAGWAGHNGCKPNIITEDPPGPLSTMRYEGCRDGAEVRLIRIDGLGHTWAKVEVDATTVMWQFFKSHRLTATASRN
jgi:polyhydroxybutyrate depolymerase